MQSEELSVVQNSIEAVVGNNIRLSAAHKYRSADKSLARPGKKKPTATEDFDFHVFYL